MISLGIIGTGRIACRFVSEMRLVQGVDAVVAYNPNKESAKQFAEEFGISGYTDRLEDLYCQVEAVYIASPHATHYEYVKQLLFHRIHVLCEKPMVFEEKQAQELFEIARQHNCILMEGIKTAYCPGFRRMMEVVRSGIIGRICDVEACFTKLTPTNLREMTDETYGGSFTELGTYVLLPIVELLGNDWNKIQFFSLPNANGIDGYTKCFLDYGDKLGMVKTGLSVKSEGQLVISGTKGYILAESPWWLTKKFEVRYENPFEKQVYTEEYKGHGLRYEIEAFVEAIQSEESARISEKRAQLSVGLAAMMEEFFRQQPRRKNTAVESAVKIWAHRGCSLMCPENTLEAFEAAAKLGTKLTGIELDVQMTKDGACVVIHDEDVKRTTDGKGLVIDYTLREIKELNVSFQSGRSFKIPTLQEVFELLRPYCELNGLLINIELKNSVQRYKGMEEKILSLVKTFKLEPYVWYSSFLSESMQLIKTIDPAARTAVLAYSLEECAKQAVNIDADALHPCVAGLDYSLLGKEQGMPIRAWNMDEPLYGEKRTLKKTDLRKYAAFGVTDVFTNMAERYIEMD